MSELSQASVLLLGYKPSAPFHMSVWARQRQLSKALFRHKILKQPKRLLQYLKGALCWRPPLTAALLYRSHHSSRSSSGLSVRHAYLRWDWGDQRQTELRASAPWCTAPSQMHGCQWLGEGGKGWGCWCVWHRQRCMIHVYVGDGWMDGWEGNSPAATGVASQSCQSVPEQDTRYRSAQPQLLSGDLNHFHTAQLEAGGTSRLKTGISSPFGNPEAAVWLDVSRGEYAVAAFSRKLHIWIFF